MYSETSLIKTLRNKHTSKVALVYTAEMRTPKAISICPNGVHNRMILLYMYVHCL